MMTLALMLFGFACSLGGFLVYQRKGVVEDLSMWPAYYLSGVLFFGGACLGFWAAGEIVRSWLEIVRSWL